jgi:gas vesicle protein
MFGKCTEVFVMCNKSGSTIGALIFGGLIGAGLGLLFAPRPGNETREIIMDRVFEYWDNADEIYGAASDRAVELYATSRDVAMDATEQVRVKIETARARLLDEVEAVTGKVATAAEEYVSATAEPGEGVLDESAAASGEPAS